MGFPSQPDLGWGTLQPDLGWGTPQTDLGWSTPRKTWDGVPPGQTWDGVPPSWDGVLPHNGEQTDIPKYKYYQGVKNFVLVTHMQNSSSILRQTDDESSMF